MQMDQHARSPSRMSLRIDFAMKSTESRGETLSSGMGHIALTLKTIF
jgi:hypothetical protein